MANQTGRHEAAQSSGVVPVQFSAVDADRAGTPLPPADRAAPTRSPFEPSATAARGE
ncbi:hypothetical protein [Qaidamihabitans albus]|uniref:hypothetical protein n=1 Tax=Qaidamihabitans albus TaxID=2795733 RepID=UPI0018F1FB0B|nr:hypothetical protein [Qaidamihabitans albus]